MGLPAELIDAFSRLSTGETPPEDDASPAGPDFWNTVKKVERTLASELEGWENIESVCARLETAARDEIAAGQRPDLDSVIEFVEQQEKEIRAEYLPRFQQARKHLRGSLQLPPEARPRLIPLYKKQISAYHRILQGMADFKLRLIALRALSEPAGDGEIFSDPKALRKHLDSL